MQTQTYKEKEQRAGVKVWKGVGLEASSVRGVSTTHIATICPNTSRCMWTQRCTLAWTGCHQICRNHKAKSFSEGCVAEAEGAHISKAAATVSLCRVTCQDATWYKNVLTFFSILKCKSDLFSYFLVREQIKIQKWDNRTMYLVHILYIQINSFFIYIFVNAADLTLIFL